MNVAVDAPTRPVLRYHGGKWKLAPWVLAHCPPHVGYIEPFCGAASVLLRKPRVQTEVINDLNSDVVNLFHVLQSPPQAEELRRLCELTPFARDEFDQSYEPAETPVERARNYIIRSFFGYGSKSNVSRSKNGFRTLRTGENSPAVDWARWPDVVPMLVRRLRGVVIEHREAVYVIEAFDRPEHLFYVDPPYVHVSRNLVHGTYSHELTDDDHRALATTLRNCQGAVVLSGYPSELYEELYGDWTLVQRRAYADKSSPRTECLWLNKACVDRLGGQIRLPLEG